MQSKAISRRNFVRFAGLTGVAAALTACAPPAPAKAPDAKDAPSGKPVGAEKANISFMGWGGPEESQAVLDMIKRFEELNPEVKVAWQHTPEDYMPKLMSMIAAGTPPDTLFTPQDFYKTFCKQGLMLDIDDQLKADKTMDTKTYFLQPQEDSRSAYNGRWHGIGVCWVGQHLFYNADMFKEAGIEPPSTDPAKAWSWDHFVEVAKQFTKDSKGKHPDDAGFDATDIVQWGVSYETGGHFQQSMPLMNGVDALDSTTNKFQYDNPAAVEAFQNVADLMHKHHVAPLAANFKDLGMSFDQMLDNRKLAMSINGTYVLAWTHKIKATLGVAVPPKMKQSAAAVVADVRAAMKATKYPDAAYKWVRMTGDPTYQSTFLKIGLWWPNQTALMKPEGLKSWIIDRKSGTEGIHPPGYYELVDKFVRNNTKAMVCPPGFPEADKIVSSGLESVWNGTTTAQEAVKGFIGKANDVLTKANA